jgi:hypothetical protein
MSESDLFYAVDSLRRASEYRRMMAEVRYRESEFSSPLSMQLAIIASSENLRQRLYERLSLIAYNGRRRIPTTTVPELIIGGGLHAAIYAGIRRNMGFPAPYVLEKNVTPGGAFAMTQSPTFYLNSENRQGMIGLPARGEALNVLPGAIIQPSYLSSGEYPTNADLAFAIQLTLASSARVFTRSEVKQVDDYGSPISVYLDNGDAIQARRVIDARGLGEAEKIDAKRSTQILSITEFLRRFDESPFPLQGFKRVAVVGGGDSGKIAVEALTGLSPARSMSLRAVDQVERIDWYARNLPATNEAWRDRERGRYSRLASYLPTIRDDNAFHDVTVISERGTIVPTGDGTAQVNGRTYDHVIQATGFTLPPSILESTYLETVYDQTGNIRLALKSERESEYYKIGTVADMQFDGYDDRNGTNLIDNNRVAIFRLAPKTAALAAMLPAVSE